MTFQAANTAQKMKFSIKVSSVNVTKSVKDAVKDLICKIFLWEIRAENTADNSNQVTHQSELLGMC